MAAAGDCAYVGLWEDGLQVVDVHNPQQPALGGHLDVDPTGREEIYDLTAAGRFVYPLVRQTVYVVDVQDADHPRAVATLPLTCSGGAPLVVAGDLGYALTSDAGGATYLQVVDLKDPANAGLQGRLGIPGASYLAVANTFIYVVSRQVHPSDDTSSGVSCTAELWVVDASDPLRPQHLATWGPVAGCDHTVTVGGGCAYFAGRILDIGDPARPREVGVYEAGEGDMIAVDGLLFVARGDGGLHVLRPVRLGKG